MKKIIYLIVSCWIFVSCGDFLKEYSKELTYASSCADLDEIMIGNGYMKSETKNTDFQGSSVSQGTSYYPWLHVMDDDIEEYGKGTFSESSTSQPAVFLRPFYTWAAELFQDIKGVPYDDPNWKKLYEHIGYLNVIISQVKEFHDEPIETRNRIKGEAEFLRGAYYYLLVNMYAKPYVKATADKDPGVVLNITEDIDGGYVSRASVARIYEQIVEDLKNAADHLKGVEENLIYRVRERAARVLLSRVYLYMGEWQAAIDECDKVLAIGSSLWDMNEWDMDEIAPSVSTSDIWFKKQYLLTEASPEILFTQGGDYAQTLMREKNNYIEYKVSDDLLQLYSRFENEGIEDLRLSGYFSESRANPGSYFIRKNSPDVSIPARVFDIFTIRTAEVYLNKAEAQAILGQSGAIATLKPLLEKRLKNGVLPTSIEGLDGERLVQFIREERRRELCFECHRWFDLRRYAVCKEYPEVKERIVHPVYSPAQLSGVAAVYRGYSELGSYEKDASSYLLAIPGYEITYNKGEMVQNEERKDHQIIE